MNTSKSARNNFILQGSILAIAGVIARLIGLLKRIPLTNIIGNKGNGYYASAYEIYAMVLLLSSYSLPLAVSKLVAARISKGQYKNAQKIFKGALLFAFIVGTVVSVVVFLFADYLAGTIMLEPMSVFALKVLTPTLFLAAIMGVFRGYFQGLGTMMPTAMSQVIEQILLVISSLLAAYFMYDYGEKVGALMQNTDYAPALGAAGGTLGCCVGALFGLGFLIFVYMAYRPKFIRQIKKDVSKSDETMKQVFRSLILTIIPVILSTAVYNLSTLVNQRIYYQVMIEQGMEAIKTEYWGMFSGKYRVLTNIPIALASAMSSSLIPTISAAMSKHDIGLAKHKIATVIRFTMLISIPCAVGLGVLGRPVLDMLFSNDNVMSAQMLNYGSVAVVLFSLSTLSNGILQGISHMKIPIRNALISLAIEVFALFFMLEFTQLNIFAVVIANIVFSGSMCVLNSLAIKKYLHYKQEARKTFLIPAMCAAIMGSIVWMIYLVFSSFAGNIISVTLSVIVGVICYFILIILLKGITANEIRLMPMGNRIVQVAVKLHLLTDYTEK